MKKAIMLLLLCACLLLTACAAQAEAEATLPEQENIQPEPVQPESGPAQPAAAAAAEDEIIPLTEQDAAWFAQAEACADWPALTVDGTSIYELEQDDIERVYGASTRIYHGMEIGTDYYDIVQFADGSQAAGWMGTDGKIHHPNAAYLRLDAETGDYVFRQQSRGTKHRSCSSWMTTPRSCCSAARSCTWANTAISHTRTAYRKSSSCATRRK